MKFAEIISRLTGVSTPIFGVSWNPREPHVAVARRVVTYLEDRRVLYNPYELEIPQHCVTSVLEIRQFLTDEIAALNDDSGLSQNLTAMRTACRKFLDTVQADDRIIQFGFYRDRGHYASWIFNSALGELRGVVGIHLAQVAAQHGLDIKDELASILPTKDGPT